MMRLQSLRTFLARAGQLAKLAGAVAMASAPLAPAAHAQTAPSMAAYCKAGFAAYPDGIQGLPPIFKYNLCWWLEDAGIAPAAFDQVVAATPRPASHQELVSRLRAQADAHAQTARQLDTGGLAPGSQAALAAAGEWRKAAFYGKLTRRPKQAPTDDLRASERALQLTGAAPERIEATLDGKRFVGYFQPAASQGARAPLVIVFGGLDNFKTEMARHVAAMRARGFATLVLENPDTGENTLSFRPEAWRMLNAARDALQGRPDVDLARVGVYGWSMGGYLATLGGLQSDWIAAVVNVAGPVESSFANGHCLRIPSSVGAAYALFAGLAPTAPRDAMCAHYARYALSKAMHIGPAAQRKPVLMLNGLLEDLTAKDEPASLRALGLSVTELSYANVGHTAEGNMRDHLRMAADWLWSRVAGSPDHPTSD
ncbi:alpha/beta hydrolase [Pseudorhodoferax sp. LjRoot39]|uniref:alpha/beta hydrolase family protein n=1 Tax=Pseudorhodoferax sp. LjRoot39 TaxID=3342328 RepID=UPI003ECEB9FB